MTELEPCPFCGEATGIIVIPEIGGECFYLLCGECGSRSSYENSEAEAIAAWNHRANPLADKLAEALEPFADGDVDASGTAVILYVDASQAIMKAIDTLAEYRAQKKGGE